MSWKPVVRIRGEGDKWHDNALRFNTYDEAYRNACDLFHRWTLTTAYDAMESDDPVTYRYTDDGQSIAVIDA